MHSVLIEEQVFLIRTLEDAHWLAHFFCGLLIVESEKGIAKEIPYSDDRSLVGFHIVITGNMFLFLPIEQKRKSITTLDNLIMQVQIR
jgi:hypothetical protein